MKRRKILIRFGIVIVILLTAIPALAKPVTQSITLQSGWNAVFLEVEPADNSPAAVFAGLPGLTSAWRWLPNTGTVQFVQDPNTLVPNQPGMLSYFPGNELLTNLHAMHGSTAYLIQMTSAATLNITGEPVNTEIHWQPDSYNFVGFYLPDGTATTYTDFFSNFPDYDADGRAIYILRNNQWEAVQVSDPMTKGEAFWIYCQGSSQFTGPMTLTLPNKDGLHYGAKLDEQEIILQNNYSSEITVQLAMQADYPLYYWFFTFTNENEPGQGGTGEWRKLHDNPLAVPIGPGDKRRVRLGVKRVELGVNEADWVANLQVDVSASIPLQQLLLPVSAEKADFSGLWSGYVTAYRVNEIRKGTTLKNTGSEFTFRLLIHVDANNVPRLLNEVIMMWDDGEWIADPDDLGKLIPDPDNPGEYVLFADDVLIPADISGASMLDGKEVGRRISSAAFGNFYLENARPAPVGDVENTAVYTDFSAMAAKEFTGQFNQGAALQTTLFLPHDDPTNPFVHKYHPKHFAPEYNDYNSQWSHEKNYRFDITRTITLTLQDTDSEGELIVADTNLSWGSTMVGGLYQEDIEGLFKDKKIGGVDFDPVKVEGIFILRKISDIDTITWQ